MPLMTLNPPRSQTQISTQSQNHLTTHSPRIPTAVEISTQGQSHALNPSLAIPATVEVMSYSNDVDRDDGRYPPRPRPRPPAGGGGGGYSSYGNSDNTHGRGGYRPNSRYGNTYGGDHHSTYGNPEGNMVAKIVSPIVSVVVVTLLGAAASYFKLNNRRNCFRTHEPENV
ncbi:glycoprotein Xg isoform X5 [Gorilla gorilla gorilla]|uniref:glycoprotein Xg isoform X5 n=1 Tax=Gorilla gorilla gorilla TaxID=9595 RepID=UPI003008A3A2